MIFIGAGMSKAFGLKTMPELYGEVKSRIEEEGSEKQLEIVKNVERGLLAIGYGESDIDIESVFSVLSGMLTPWVSIVEAGTFSSYVASDLLGRWMPLRRIQQNRSDSLKDLYSPFQRSVKPLLETAEKVISDECKKISISKVRQIYDSLFDAISYPKNKQVKHPVSETTVEMIPRCLATTNYDLAIESYFRAKNWDPPDDGFQYKSVDQLLHFFLNPRSIPTSLGLIKLHGSIDWFMRTDGEMVKLRDEPSQEPFHEDRFEGKVMVYPMQEKYVSRDPWGILFTLFRQQLFAEEIHISVGYSFRDQAINNAFLDAARKKPLFYLFVVNPKAKEIMDRIGMPKNKYKAIPYKIEDQNAIDELRRDLT